MCAGRGWGVACASALGRGPVGGGLWLEFPSKGIRKGIRMSRHKLRRLGWRSFMVQWRLHLGRCNELLPVRRHHRRHRCRAAVAQPAVATEPAALAAGPVLLVYTLMNEALSWSDANTTTVWRRGPAVG